jgi:hypothetical protein
LTDPLTTRTPITLCPLCGHTIDAATSLASPEAWPEPGDWTVCFACAGVLMFDTEFRLVVVPVAEVAAAVAEDADLARTIAAVRRLRAAVGVPRSRGRRH